jgi:multiple sugar transport system permease protein
VTLAALGCSGAYLLELLGPEATPALETLAAVLVALAATSLAALGYLQRGPSRWSGPSAGALMILSISFVPGPPLYGFAAAGIASIAGLTSVYAFAHRQLSEKTLDHLSGWLFVLPALLLMLVWIYFPAIYAFWISLFKDFNYLGVAEFVGLENYAIAFRDPLFLRALTNTAWYVAGTVPVSIFLGVFIAILLNERIKGLPLYRLAYFLPYITALTAAAAVWRWIYNPNVGLLNWMLGLEGFRWLANPDGLFELLLAPLGLSLPQLIAGPSVALCAIMLMSIWHFLGYNVVIFLAGLQSIPREYYEAARIDGASWLQQVRYLTWPLLSPTTFFVLIISLIGSLNVFTQIFIMTPTGGVLNDTLSAVMYLYFKGFRDFDFGYASALAFILFVLTLALTLLQRRFFTRLQGVDREAI